MFRCPKSGFTRSTHHADLPSFTEAAADGCNCCILLLKYAMENVDSLENCLVEPQEYWFYTSEDKMWLVFDMTMRKEGKIAKDSISFLIVPTSQLPVNTRIWGRESVIPLLEATEAARTWISDCLNAHTQCPLNTQPQSYPTRLLKLGNSMASLVLPKELYLSGPYAALSYCWGENLDFICLTTEDLTNLRSGIPYSAMPTAFQEAIALIRDFSIDYLWIDALCIIQSGIDSAEDWTFEYTRMQDVYSNCIVNSSLAQAEHPNMTCLGGHNLDVPLPFEVETFIYADTGQWDSKASRCTVMRDDYYLEGLYNQPIGYRAWVLQERLLATRVLSVGSGELFWDCAQVPHASKSLPYGFSRCSLLLNSTIGSRLDLSVNAIPQVSDNRTLQELWYRIVEDYTARQLTYPEVDKLVALFAIASRMCEAMDDVYLTGHFLKILPKSLNWRSASKRTKRRFPVTVT
jgi:hypothetical protein